MTTTYSRWITHGETAKQAKSGLDSKKANTASNTPKAVARE
jgi:hypothetical protein